MERRMRRTSETIPSCPPGSDGARTESAELGWREQGGERKTGGAGTERLSDGDTPRARRPQRPPGQREGEGPYPDARGGRGSLGALPGERTGGAFAG